MSGGQDLLAKAVASIVGKKEERAVASLFTPGGTHAMKGEFQGINDFEVVAFLVVLPEATSRMSFAPVIDALAIPPNARVDQRVPKKLLLEQSAPTAADKRQIQDGIEELALGGRAQAHQYRRAGLPGRRTGVSGDRGAHRHVSAPPRSRLRLIELIHRAIPYPLVLVAAHGRHRQPVAGAQTLVAGRGGEGGHRGRDRHRSIAPGYARARRGLVSSQVSQCRACLPVTCLRFIKGGSTAWPHLKRPRSPAALPRRTPRNAPPLVGDGLDMHARLQRDLGILRARPRRKSSSIAAWN